MRSGSRQRGLTRQNYWMWKWSVGMVKSLEPVDEEEEGRKRGGRKGDEKEKLRRR